MQKNNRAFAKKSDIILIAVLLVACICALLFVSKPSKTKNYAILSVDNKVVATYYLGDHVEHSVEDLQVYGFPGQLEFESGAARFSEVDCPDKICQSVGYVESEMDAIICLPNKTSLTIYTPDDFARMKNKISSK